MNLDLKGKHALVCGSTQGIGKSIAIELSKMGANVTLIARNVQKLRSTLKELHKSKEQKHHFICADFSFPPELKLKVESFLENSGPVHILINNTGGPASGQLSNANVEDLLSAYNNHLICNHLLMKATVEGMKTEKYGRIINIISTSVKIPLDNLGVSNTTRGAVANWSKTLANELGQYGITVNNILPGATKTSRLESIIENKAKQTSTSIDQVEQNMLKSIPAKRFGLPEEVAYAACFLASPAASYINGINIPVDGGRTGSL